MLRKGLQQATQGYKSVLKGSLRQLGLGWMGPTRRVSSRYSRLTGGNRAASHAGLPPAVRGMRSGSWFTACHWSCMEVVSTAMRSGDLTASNSGMTGGGGASASSWSCLALAGSTSLDSLTAPESSFMPSATFPLLTALPLLSGAGLRLGFVYCLFKNPGLMEDGCLLRPCSFTWETIATPPPWASMLYFKWGAPWASLIGIYCCSGLEKMKSLLHLNWAGRQGLLILRCNCLMANIARCIIGT